MGKKLVLLGSIGVLAETSEIQRQAYNQALAEAGLNWHWDAATYSDLLGHTGGQDRLALLNAATGGTLSTEDIVSIHQRKTEIACAAIRTQGVSLRPGVASLIAQCLEAGVALGLVTTTYRVNIDAIGDAAGAALALSQFDVIVSRDDVSVGKPDPAAYHYALAETGMAPGDTIAIEDTAASILAARQADIEVIATPGTLSRGQSLFNAQHVLDQLAGPDGSLDPLVADLVFGDDTSPALRLASA